MGLTTSQMPAKRFSASDILSFVLLLLIMSLLGEDIDQHGLAVHGVDNPVCLVDAAGPFAGEVVPEWLRLSYAGVWMFCDVPEDFLYLFGRGEGRQSYSSSMFTTS